MNAEQLVRTSKFLSLVLRHRPEVAQLQLDPSGWVLVAELLSGCQRCHRPLTPGQLREVVAKNDKQRFELSADGARIRASQGHSVDVQLGYAPTLPPPVLFHGTASDCLPRILEQGLRKGRRHHVHLSPDATSATRVGQRRGKPVVLQVAARCMHQDGHEFFLSTNGVWLTDHVPPRYLRTPADP